MTARAAEAGAVRRHGRRGDGGEDQGKAQAVRDATMGRDAIEALPIGDLAAPDAILWLWATNPMLPDAFAVLRAWGFTFKTTRHGKLAFGTGYILRCAGEPFLIGTRGQPRTSRSVRSVVMGPIRQHSRKPDEAYTEAARLLPNVHRLDLFARQLRPGWTAWGNEADKFGVAA
jgi:N6-adenosine-specific RNA methylase IME4